MEPIFHFYLACLEIAFSNAEGETGVTRVNTMLKSESQSIGVLGLGRGQQAAQMQLMKNLNDPNLNIHNVVYVAISYIGQMTDEEFQRTEDPNLISVGNH